MITMTTMIHIPYGNDDGDDDNDGRIENDDEYDMNDMMLIHMTMMTIVMVT